MVTPLMVVLKSIAFSGEDRFEASDRRCGHSLRELDGILKPFDLDDKPNCCV